MWGVKVKNGDTMHREALRGRLYVPSVLDDKDFPRASWEIGDFALQGCILNTNI